MASLDPAEQGSHLAVATSPRRVLVTGAAGFTGRYLVQELLAHGWQVWGMQQGSHSSAELSQGMHVVQADLLNPASLDAAVQQVQPHAVVHLAAVAFVAHGNAEDFYRVNVAGTRHLLAALANLPQVPQKVLLASSANVYGAAAQGQLDEATPFDPANDYAVSKVAMEMMARLWRDRLPLVITRPFNYTGWGQAENFLVPKIVAHFRRRAPHIELGNLDVWRDFSDVRQVVQIYRRLLDTPDLDSGSVFNVGSEQLYSLREIIAMAENLTEHTLQVSVNPAFVRANEVKTLCASTARLRQVLGNDQPIVLRDTLAWMLDAHA